MNWYMVIFCGGGFRFVQADDRDGAISAALELTGRKRSRVFSVRECSAPIAGIDK